MAFGGGAGPGKGGTLVRGAAQAPVVRLPSTGRRDPILDPATRRSPFPELDCVRDRLSLGTIAAVERRAIAIGVGADRVLIANGVIEEEAYLIGLARWLGWDYETFERRSRHSCPLHDDRLIEGARTGLLPLKVDGTIEFVVAPRSVRQLLDFVALYPRSRFRLTSSHRMNGFIADFAAEALGRKAADELRHRSPDLSSATRSARSWITFVALLAILVGALVAVPKHAIAVVEMFLAGCFLLWLALRLIGCFIKPKPVKTRPVADRDLPVYTAIVALYREAQTVDALVASLRQLDYPGIR